MTEGPPRHLHPVEPPFDPNYDTPSRPVPADRGAEQAILATLLVAPELGEHLAHELDSSDFYWPIHQQIWDTWHHLATTDGVPPDAVVLNAALTRRGNVEAVRTLTDLVLTQTNPILADQYATLVRDASRLRTVADVAAGLTQIATTGRADQVDLRLGEALQRLDEAAMRFGPRTTGHSTWAALDLEQVLAGGEVDPPPALLARGDGQHLLYAGAVHTVSGEPGSGKTWLCLIAAVQQLAEGHTVTMIDFEDRASRVVGRLLALGARPDDVRHRFRYVRPNTGVDPSSQPDLDHATHGATLVILDGVTEAMTMHGLDLNSNADVAKFYDLLPRHIADHGPAVVMIDHVVKDGEKQGRWALGGQHKLAGIDGVAYLVQAIDKFGRGKTGTARVTVSKDRPGYVEEIALGRTVAELLLDATDVNCLRHELRAPVAAPTDDAGNMRPTHLMERVSRYIEITPGLSKRDLIDGRISGKGAYLRRAIDRLIQEGYVEVTEGPNRKQSHRSITPFREDEDAMHTNPNWADQEPLR